MPSVCITVAARLCYPVEKRANYFSTGDYYVQLFRRELEMTETVDRSIDVASDCIGRRCTSNATEIAPRKLCGVARASGLINSFLIVKWIVLTGRLPGQRIMHAVYGQLEEP